MAHGVAREAKGVHDAIKDLFSARVDDPVRHVFATKAVLREEATDHRRDLESHQVGHLRRDGERELVLVVEPIVAQRAERVGQEQALKAVERRPQLAVVGARCERRLGRGADEDGCGRAVPEERIGECGGDIGLARVPYVPAGAGARQRVLARGRQWVGAVDGAGAQGSGR